MKLTIENSADTVIGFVEGRLDTAASAQFSQDMQPILENASKNIVLDCTKMEIISSSGLRLFLSIRKQAMADGGNVTIKGATPDVKQVFTITGFTALFKFVD